MAVKVELVSTKGEGLEVTMTVGRCLESDIPLFQLHFHSEGAMSTAYINITQEEMAKLMVELQEKV